MKNCYCDKMKIPKCEICSKDKEIDNIIDNILEEMIDEMGEGGMDVSYSGHNYETAKVKAIAKIKKL